MASARNLFAVLLAAPLMAAHNPVLPGDYPDPSVIRVGNDYWATATTSQWLPAFPILHSTDLQHWKIVSAVFPQKPAWAETNFWAPEIATDNGKFFVYYTARKVNGPLCVAVATAAAPVGPWADHGPLVCQEDGSIDAVPVTAEDGQRYLIWKEDGNSRRRPTPLWAQRLTADGTRLTGQPKELFHNDAGWEGAVVEGPFVLRREGWFYLFYSGAGCCGANCNYALGVARSRRLLGPWEKYPANPILAGNSTWKCPGHGSIVTTAGGRHFLLYHAYDALTSVFVGRQGMLDEVTWRPTGWPQINEGYGPGTEIGNALAPERDNFQGRQLAPEWQWPVTQTRPPAVENGRLVIAPGAIAARQARTASYTAEIVVDANSVGAGLAAWDSAGNAGGLSVAAGAVTLWRREKGIEKALAEAPAAVGSRIHLRMKASGGRRYEFSFAANGRTWTALPQGVDGDHLPPWDLGTRVALTCRGAAACRFDSLVITPGATID